MSATDTVRVGLTDLRAQHAELREELLGAFGRVLDHGQFILGPEVDELERLWARECGVRHAVSVSDGTTAMVLVLRAMGLRPDDEVITAPNSFVSTAASVIHAGGVPRFADVGDDHNLDPQAVRAAITRRTHGIMPVHLYGRPANMTALRGIADEHGLFLVEDAAQAFGARHAGSPVGSAGTAGCFSMHPLKAAGACGDAGMITTNDDALAERLRRLRNHGILKRQDDCAYWGHNARMDTLQAALVLVKMPFVTEWTSRRRSFAAMYRTRLEGRVGLPVDRPGDEPIYQGFPIEVDRRDELLVHLRSAGIVAGVPYPVPIHLLEAARGLGHRSGDFPVTERLARRCVHLPIHHNLREDDIEYVCDAVKKFIETPQPIRLSA